LIEQGLTSPPTQYRLYGQRFLQVKRPNQQYQSTEGTAHMCNWQQRDKQTNGHVNVWSPFPLCETGA